MISIKNGIISISFQKSYTYIKRGRIFFEKNGITLLILGSSILSVIVFAHYLQNGLGLAYNDARSHLDIGRRVVEGLKPGLAQLGSVWLPLPHLLMIPTIWNDYMWHTGLSGAVQSMVSFVATPVLIYFFLKEIGVGILGRIIGILIFVTNLNILYLQSTAMTELLLIATMTAAAYDLLLWFKRDSLINLVKAAFWVMLATLVRYDGWFLLALSTAIITFQVWRKKGYKATEGTILLYLTLASLGVVLWLVWNQLIFNDALYFIFGPYSARAQQKELEVAGILATKGNIVFSTKVYLYALAYNSNTFMLVLSCIGAVLFWFNRKVKNTIKIASSALFAPLLFNILALYLGHSVLFIQGLSGDTWFNVRYGVMMMPAIAIFIGYLVDQLKSLRVMIIGLLAFVTFFSFASYDAVTIDDARVGSSQKNVSEVSGWLAENAAEKPGFVLISAASHDAIIFSSGMPMKKFIHEGTGIYWDTATVAPEKWARWIIMRTNDENDLTFKLVSKTPAFKNGAYTLVEHYPFADVYEIKPEYLGKINVKPSLDHLQP